MDNKKLKQIGDWLIDKDIITDYDIEDNGKDFEWVNFQLLIGNKTLAIEFNKEFGYIMSITTEDTLDMLD